MRRLAILLCFLLLPAPLLADIREEAVFTIAANGHHVGEMALEFQETDGQYRFDVASWATGIFGFVTRAQYDGWSEGQRTEDGLLQSSLFTSRSERVFKTREVQVRFDVSGMPLEVTITPESERTSHSHPALIPPGRIDSLSYLATLFLPLAGTCPGPADLYDGRRMTRIELMAEPGPEGRLICTGTYRITAGPDHSLRKG
ncbi:MAG: DUF3108 domain-containing protein, partial [Rhodobacteraceae bacterium]|nr:DUF3108 domain-containing protein [Paracoccaceae bacterium]